MSPVHETEVSLGQAIFGEASLGDQRRTARLVKSFDLMRRHPGRRLGDIIRRDTVLWEKFLRPVLLSALNTAPEEASADLAGAIVRETLAKGGRHMEPLVASPSLAAAFVDKAYVVISGGTDSHIVLLDVGSRELTGAIAEGALEREMEPAGDRHPDSDRAPDAALAVDL